MTYYVAFDLGIAGLLIAIASSTICARAAFVSLILFMIYGLLLAIVWVRLSAVDVALTETAIGGGVTGMLLLGAATRLRVTSGCAAHPCADCKGKFGIKRSWQSGRRCSVCLPCARYAA